MLEDIKGIEQTAVMIGRTIIENMQLSRGVTSHVNANKVQAVMIALDQGKEFE